MPTAAAAATVDSRGVRTRAEPGVSNQARGVSGPIDGVHLNPLGLAKRWLLGTHHGAVRPKHLQAYLDEYVFRFNRRTAKSISHRFARLIEQAILTPPATYRTIVGQATVT